MTSSKFFSSLRFSPLFREWLLLVLSTMFLSGLLYYLGLHLSSLSAFLFRALRMLLLYVLVPIFWIAYRERVSVSSALGLTFHRTALSLIGGTTVYAVALVVFLHFHIFEAGWKYTPLSQIPLYTFLVAIMACATDFWTRGFVLLFIERHFNWKLAILLQNLTWFSLHVYEVLLIASYLAPGVQGYFYALLLTLFLGICGDLVVLYTRNISGLMIGHIVLNLGIIANAKVGSQPLALVLFWVHLFC